MPNQARAVRKAAEKAERLHAEIYPETPDTPEEVPPVPEDAPADEVPAPEDAPPVPQPAPEPQPESEPEPPPAVAQDENFKQKYQTLQGMFNAEVPRLNAEIARLKQQVESQEALLQTQPAPAEPATTPSKLISPEEVDDFGEDLTDYIRRAAKETLGPELEELRAANLTLKNENLQLHKIMGNVEAEQAGDARELLLRELAREVPDWAVINETPEFLTWLQHVEPLIGRQRHALLLEAFEANKTEQVVSFFKSYAKERAMLSAPPPTPTPVEPTVPLNTLIVPGQAPQIGSQPPQAGGANQRQWSQDEVSAFYKDVQLGRYRGREVEKDKTEQAIVKAAREGRIR